MRLKVSALRRVVREAIGSKLGWPTASVEHVYGVPDRLADAHPTDMGNLRLPKGPNSRDDADDRPLEDDLDGGSKPKQGYGASRGVGYNSKSNNDAGRGGGGGG